MTTPHDVRMLGRQLIEHNLLLPTDVLGLYHRSEPFERIVRAVSALIHRAGPGNAATLMLPPPVLPREVLERTDYLRSFPDLAGSIDTFAGGDQEHADLLRAVDSGGNWAELLAPAEVVLAPAACYSVYPQLQGGLRNTSERYEVEGWCFRHEPSSDPTRMQSFRMREFVYVGTPDGARAQRDSWLDRAVDVLINLELPINVVPANDPFFGRAGRILASRQREEQLKFEIVCPIASSEFPTAIASANYHEDHFGRPFEIALPDGTTAHSACFGFGLERVALALLQTHGFEPEQWPTGVADQLWK